MSSGSEGARTPPRHLPGRIKNPFERTLVDRLNSHVCSPGMFKIRESSGSFKWDIEQVSILKPADIVACSSQFNPTPDPILEKKASEAIEKFFSQETIVPSPFNQPLQRIPLPIEAKDTNSTPESAKLTTWSQTHLTFPTQLPPEVENILKPYYSYTKDQSNDCDDMSANASLKRKLCFEGEFSDEDENAMNVFGKCATETNNFFSCDLKRNSENIENMSFGKEIYVSDELHFKITSPLFKADSKTRSESNEEISSIKSPSISPIKRASSMDHEFSMTPDIPKNSPTNCNISTFSQSTPEKTLPNAIDDKNSSLNLFDTSETHLLKRRFNDDMCQFGKNVMKLYKRSQSEMSLIDKNSSMNKPDFNMDISCDMSSSNSRNQSFHSSHSDIDIKIFSSKSVMPINSTMRENCFSKISHVENINHNNDNHPYIFNNERRILNFEDNSNSFEIYQYLTPTKKYDTETMDCKSTAKRLLPLSSPMQVFPSKDHMKSSLYDDVISNIDKEFPIHIDTNKIVSGTLQRMDSGFLESINEDKLQSFQNITHCNLTYSNTSKSSSMEEVLKPFQCNSSNSKWKRFDSGFHDEASSDFTQNNINESMKFSLKKCPITENIYLEDHNESMHSDESNNVNKDNYKNEMSTSSFFTSEMFSLVNSNFSSTPSKQYKK